jgi:hypothetical protein
MRVDMRVDRHLAEAAVIGTCRGARQEEDFQKGKCPPRYSSYCARICLQRVQRSRKSAEEGSISATKKWDVGMVLLPQGYVSFCLPPLAAYSHSCSEGSRLSPSIPPAQAQYSTESL